MGRIKTEVVKPTKLDQLRELNQKIFPILSGSNINDSFYKNFCDEKHGYAVFGLCSDMLAGAVCCLLDKNEGMYLKFIGVINRHRRKGVATQMLTSVLEHATNINIKTVYMYVQSDNKAIMALGRKFGFENVGKAKNDLVILEKDMTSTAS